MKNPASAMLSCNDGFRPVSFLVEALEGPEGPERPEREPEGRPAGQPEEQPAGQPSEKTDND